MDQSEEIKVPTIGGFDFATLQPYAIPIGIAIILILLSKHHKINCTSINFSHKKLASS